MRHGNRVRRFEIVDAHARVAGRDETHLARCVRGERHRRRVGQVIAGFRSRSRTALPLRSGRSGLTAVAFVIALDELPLSRGPQPHPTSVTETGGEITPVR